MTTASPTRPGVSMRGWRRARRTHPGANRRSGQTATTASEGRSQATARPVSRGRPPREVIGCGSYDAALDWPPMPMASRAPSTPLLVAAGIAVVIALAVFVSIDLTDAFDRSIIEAVRSDLARDVLSPLQYITELASSAAGGAVAGAPRS